MDASYDGLLPIGEHRSITGIIIYPGTTEIFTNTHIQHTTDLSLTEADIITGCDADKDITYVHKLFCDLQFPSTQPTIIAKDNAGSILVTNPRHPSGRTHHLNKSGLMQFFNIDGTSIPSDAMPKVLLFSIVTILIASWSIKPPPTQILVSAPT
jgi:hypothetical protein